MEKGRGFRVKGKGVEQKKEREGMRRRERLFGEREGIQSKKKGG